MSLIEFNTFSELADIVESWDTVVKAGRLNLEGTFPSLDDDKLYPEGRRRLTGRELTDHVANTTAHILWQAGNFRFYERGIQQQGDGSICYEYTCAQDKNQLIKGSAMDLEVHKKLSRFGCGGRLSITVPLDHKNIKVSLQHDWHQSYTDSRRQVELEEFVGLRAADHTPEEIRRLMRVSMYFASLEITQEEITAAWKKAKADKPKDISDQLAKFKLDKETAMAAQLTRLEQPGIYNLPLEEDYSDVAWCPACGTTQAIFEFNELRSGLHELRCSRHDVAPQESTTQRKSPTLRRFDKFCESVCQWKDPRQTQDLNIKCIFPVAQVQWAFSVGEFDRPIQEIYDRAAEGLISQIQNSSCYHFGLTFQNLYPDDRRRYRYKCVQDNTYKSKDNTERKALCHDVKTHPCASSLTIEFSAGFGNVQITLEHKYHDSDYDSGLDSETIGFIWARAFRCFPVQIHEFITAFPYPVTPGDEDVALDQVTYEWEKAVMAGPVGVTQVPKQEDSDKFLEFAQEVFQQMEAGEHQALLEDLLSGRY